MQVKHKIHQLQGNIQNRQICTYDFSTLFTKLEHTVIKEQIHWLINEMFRVNKSELIKINTLFNKNKAYFAKAQQSASKGTIILSKNETHAVMDIMLNENYIKLGNNIFKQVKGIPMGNAASPILADLVLSCLEHRYILKNPGKFRRDDMIICRYIDDILCYNTSIDDISKEIYPQSLILNKDTPNENGDIPYLDLQINTGNDTIMLYDKTKHFNFKVVKGIDAASTIHTNTIKGTFMGQLQRYARINSHLKDFLKDTQQLVTAHIAKGHHKTTILEWMLRYAAKYESLMLKYGVTKKDFLAKILTKVQL